MRSFSFLLGLFATGLIHQAAQAATPSFDFLNRIQSKGGALNSETHEWIEKWRTFDLEQDQVFSFGEISGSTSINIKVREKNAAHPKGFEALGTFVPRNSAGNPNTEIAYFNLGALFGVDHLLRPAVRYELGPRGASALKNLLLATEITHPARRKNKASILAELEKGGPLRGCLKAKKPDSAVAVENVNSVRAKIQASATQPLSGRSITLRSGYTGDERELARELSILMTFDAVFGQWDRFSGGNIGIRLDQNNRAHFYFTDNGGATLSSATGRILRTLAWFNRYDRTTIANLRALNSFLAGESLSYAGYTNSQEFIVGLGLYFENSPQVYIERVRRNIGLVLKKVSETEDRYGSAAYLN